MSLSFFILVVLMMNMDQKRFKEAILPSFPKGQLIGFMTIMSTMVGMMWLMRILPSLIEGGVPVGLEHYTTLVIQALDLGFVIPISWVAIVLLAKDHVWGYLLCTVLMFKYVELLMAISAMVILMSIENKGASMVEGLIFIGFTGLALIMVAFVFRGIRSMRFA